MWCIEKLVRWNYIICSILFPLYNVYVLRIAAGGILCLESFYRRLFTIAAIIGLRSFLALSHMIYVYTTFFIMAVEDAVVPNWRKIISNHHAMLVVIALSPVPFYSTCTVLKQNYVRTRSATRYFYVIARFFSPQQWHHMLDLTWTARPWAQPIWIWIHIS